MSPQDEILQSLAQNSAIWDFSGSFYEENLPELKGIEVINCRDIEGTCRYCDDEAAKALKELVRSKHAKVNWLDSGDYHYMSLFTLGEIKEPFTLILLDNHPDMQPAEFGDVLSCGGWVRSALESNENLSKVIILGINPQLRSECEGFGDRVQVIDRDELARPSEPWLKPLINTNGVYISLDKDVLNEDESRTNWDQGTMTISLLLDLLRQIGANFNVLGMDICGSRPSSSGGTEEDALINSRLNKCIYKVILSIKSLYL